MYSVAKQEAHGPHHSTWENTREFRQCIFAILYLPPFENGLYSDHPKILLPSLVEISTVVLEKQIIKFRHFVIICPWKRARPFI